MRYSITLILILGLVSICYADRVCIEKSTGKLIEYQSGNALLGTLTKNAENLGYKKEDVEEKYVTKEEWQVIEETQIKIPARKITEKKEAEKKLKEEKIKQKLNLTDEDFNNLKEALGK